MLFQPESPRWLLKRGHDARAVDTLCYLRQVHASHEYIRFEVAAVKTQLEQERSSAGGQGLVAQLKEMWLPVNRSRISIGMVLMMAQNVRTRP